METIGTIRHIARYPVKSMRGELLDEATVGFQGIPGDRAYAFVQDGLHNQFPFLTGRECAELLRYQPEWDRSGERPKLSVRTPDGALLPVASEELRADVERRASRPVHLHSDHRGIPDIAYISVVTTSTVRAVAEAAGVEPDHRRFRMNLILEADSAPFAEQQWVGKMLRVGDVRLAVTEQDQRCVMTTFDPESGASTAAVLKTIGQMNNAFLGVYASVTSAGKVRVGDEVTVS